jgi:hypothetical protein
MDTNAEKMLFRDEVFQIVGCAIDVLNSLGHGVVEKPYENTLVVELGLRKKRRASPTERGYSESSSGEAKLAGRVRPGGYAGDGKPVSSFGRRAQATAPIFHAALLIIKHHLRRGFAQLKLRAHLVRRLLCSALANMPSSPTPPATSMLPFGSKVAV